MPLGDHLEELRTRLWRALLGLGVAVAVGFYAGDSVLKFITAPVSRALARFQQRRVDRVAARLEQGDPALLAHDGWVEVPLQVRRGGEWVREPVRITPLEWELALERTRLEVLRPPSVATLSATEPFTIYFKVSVYCGVVLASPWVFYQLWMFVAAGLYPHEKRLVRVYLPLSVGLFLGGVALCEFVVIPAGLEYLLSFNDWLGMEPNVRLSEWLGFALMMPLAFGCSFQTPLVMLFLHRVGAVPVGSFRRHRRLALFLLTVLAAVLTVTGDVVNMLWLAVPLWGLYEVGILLCRLTPRPVPQGEEVDTLVEV